MNQIMILMASVIKYVTLKKCLELIEMIPMYRIVRKMADMGNTQEDDDITKVKKVRQ